MFAQSSAQQRLAAIKEEGKHSQRTSYTEHFLEDCSKGSNACKSRSILDTMGILWSLIAPQADAEQRLQENQERHPHSTQRQTHLPDPSYRPRPGDPWWFSGLTADQRACFESRRLPPGDGAVAKVSGHKKGVRGETTHPKKQRNESIISKHRETPDAKNGQTMKSLADVGDAREPKKEPEESAAKDSNIKQEPVIEREPVAKKKLVIVEEPVSKDDSETKEHPMSKNMPVNQELIKMEESSTVKQLVVKQESE